MKNQPLVSVIIPCYNHGNYIMDAIVSVLNQTYRNFEIIIVNDGSDDLITNDILAKINNSKIKVVYQSNSGPSVAKNFGISISKGDYILPLDCDNKLEKEFLEKSVDALQENNADVVYTNYQHIGNKNDKYRSIEFNISKLLMFSFIENCSLYKKEVWIANEGYDVFLSKKGIEDWEFWLNTAKHKFSFFHLDQFLFDYMVSDNSRTNKVANKNLSETVNYIYNKHSDILAREFANLYHENKNLKSTRDYKLGKAILWPLRMIKKLLHV